jgi:hypothetical protein
MGESWVKVRDGARDGTLKSSGPEALAASARWEYVRRRAKAAPTLLDAPNQRTSALGTPRFRGRDDPLAEGDEIGAKAPEPEKGSSGGLGPSAPRQTRVVL